jgi:hypothetical protein
MYTLSTFDGHGLARVFPATAIITIKVLLSKELDCLSACHGMNTHIQVPGAVDTIRSSADHDSTLLQLGVCSHHKSRQMVLDFSKSESL